jgi:sodium-dependent dicarboxylate transporter 2/3/5
MSALGPITAKEIKWIAVIALLIITWLTEQFHKAPISVTATFGAALFFLPGINLLDWKSASSKVGWDVLLLIGASTSLGTALWDSGAATWIAGAALGGIQGSTQITALAVVIIFTIVIHLLVPVNPAIVSVLTPTLAAFAAIKGVSPALLVVPMGFTVSATFLLPLDPVPLLTYVSGHYNMGDYFKAGWLLSVVWAAVIFILMMVLGGPLGMF